MLFSCHEAALSGDKTKQYTFLRIAWPLTFLMLRDLKWICWIQYKLCSIMSISTRSSVKAKTVITVSHCKSCDVMWFLIAVTFDVSFSHALLRVAAILESINQSVNSSDIFWTFTGMINDNVVAAKALINITHKDTQMFEKKQQEIS